MNSASRGEGQCRRSCERGWRQGPGTVADDGVYVMPSKRDTLCDTLVLGVLRAYKDLGSHRGLVGS